MLDRFSKFISEKKLFDPNQKILLALSGGIDSMVLFHIFQQTGVRYGVIHCNFRLRGKDSDRDEEFVRQHVMIQGIESFFKSFDTREHARINGISIEMAARKLRYDYFEQIRSENNYDYIATAHHKDDLVETFFLNLSRKTGIKGLSGIKEKSGYIIRPLLFASREDIEKYAGNNLIEFREDYTNDETEYQRNFIRHRILPLFEELNPAFKNNLAETISNLREAEKVFLLKIKEEEEKVVSVRDRKITVNIESLLQSSFPRILLYEILTGYNFNPSVAEQVFRGLEYGSGKQYYSGTHRLIKDRNDLFIVPHSREEKKIFYIEEGDIELFAPFDLTIEQIEDKNFKIIRSTDVACLDLDKLEFPLLIRKWQQGDYFQPLGMTGYKKLSDFFIDEKIPVHEKDRIWLLCSGPKIVWIMGHRIDNRFKITPGTKRILKIEIQNRSARQYLK
jgi:tRNA(Ile)-lysidine synthase